MKIIKSNVTEIFKNQFNSKNVALEFVNGVYSPTDGSGHNPNLIITGSAGTNYKSSQIIYIDRNIYKKIKIVTTTPGLTCYLVAMGKDAAIKRFDAVPTNTVIDLTSYLLNNNSVDTWMNYYVSGEKCYYVGISITNSQWSGEDLSSVKIQLIP